MSEANSPTPLYHRIYSVIRERIVNDYYPRDVALPSEAELSASFAVSRITIRRAMNMLTDDGLVTRSRGRGTFVTTKASDNRINRAIVSDISSLLNYLNVVGKSTKLRVISLDRGEAPPRVGLQMGVERTSEVIRAVRVRNLDGAPYSLSIAYLRPEIGQAFTKKDLETASMIDLVQRAGGNVEQVEQTLAATLADETSSEHLKVPVGAPLMRLNRFFSGSDLVPFYVAEILYPADRYEYRIMLKRDPGKSFQIDGSAG